MHFNVAPLKIDWSNPTDSHKISNREKSQYLNEKCGIYIYTFQKWGPNCRICSKLFPYLFLLVNVLYILCVLK